MKTPIVVLASFLVIWGLATPWAAPSVAPDPTKAALVEGPPSEVLLNEIYDFKPAKPGHHFNLAAPTSCGSTDPVSRSPMKIRCQFTVAGSQTAIVSVCDDKKSFCKVERFPVTVKGGEGSRGIMKKFKAPPQAEVRHPPGFLLNEPDKAQADARTSGKLLFIDFYGIWCPPCNAFDELVFDRPEFQTASSQFVRLKLDADAETSGAWKDVFKVGGYPTVVVATADLQEIGRVVGFRSLKRLTTWLSEMEKARAVPIPKLQSLGRKLLPTEEKRLAQWHFDRGEFAEAAKLFPAQSQERLEAQAKQAAKDGDTKVQIQTLQRLIQKFPQGIETLGWLSELMGAEGEESVKTNAKRYKVVAQSNWGYWKSRPLPETADWTRADLMSVYADILKDLGETTDSKAMFSAAADEYLTQSKDSNLKLTRAGNLERLSCLKEAGRLDEAKRLADELAKAYSDEYTFHYARAGVLRALKDYKGALKSVNEALDHAYGDNFLNSVELKVKILKDLGETNKAKALAEEVLKGLALPKFPGSRAQRVVTRLRVAVKTL